MKLIDINRSSIRNISNKELNGLHRRVHQLYVMAKKRGTNINLQQFLKSIHLILAQEMKKRNINHRSILENYLIQKLWGRKNEKKF